jgi:hypothetical protein
VNNTVSRLEARLARILPTLPELSSAATTPTVGLDLVYLSSDDQDRLNNLLR